MKTKALLAGTAFLLTCAMALPTLAASSALANARIIRTLLVNNGTFGGCMAQLSVNPATMLPACGPSWVSLGCRTAAGVDSVIGYRMLDQAQMAQALGKMVYVQFSDTLVNGYCSVIRLDVY